jgi:Berberine and berberine like
MEPIEAADLDDLGIEKFESGLRGRILRAGDADYDVARRHYNALINKHPALIVQCTGVADVIDAVNFARTHSLPMTYLEVQSLIDPLYPPGLCQYWKSNFVQELSDEAIDMIIEHFASVSSPLTVVILDQLGGAVGRVEADETAFGHREAAHDFLITSLWRDPMQSERHILWTRQYWEAMQPFSSGLTYVNYLDEGRPGSAAKYERLVALKNRYDPTNLFRLNVNIQPTA